MTPTTKTALARTDVKKMMKLNDEVDLIASDATLAMAKAVELFIEKLARESVDQVDAGRKTMLYGDVVSAREKNARLYEFLEVSARGAASVRGVAAAPAR